MTQAELRVLMEEINSPLGIYATQIQAGARFALPVAGPADRYFLLGLQICYVALLLLLTCYVVFLGYQIADRGVDHIVEGSRKVRGIILFWSGILLACGGGFFLPLAGYWMAFEGGVNSLLGSRSGSVLVNSYSLLGLCACQLLSDSAIANQRGIKKIPASRAPAHPTFSPEPRAFLDARKIRAWRQGWARGWWADGFPISRYTQCSARRWGSDVCRLVDGTVYGDSDLDIPSAIRVDGADLLRVLAWL